jgi:chitodextrinase
LATLRPPAKRGRGHRAALIAAGYIVVLGTLGTLGSGAVSWAQTVSDPVILAAGDIADCGRTTDDATAAILDAHPEAIVQTIGDNVYEDGTAAEFADCYAPNWGRHKARTRPAAGNHEYNTSNATGYYGYFGAAAGSPTEGWYSYDAGTWHVVVLNSNCAAVGGCGVGSPQELWLRSDLAAHPTPCTLAVWHHPRFGSGLTSSSTQALWQALWDYRADVVLTGHQHSYERMALLGPTGSLNADGIRSFVVGTGGAALASSGSATTGSQVRNDNTFGVLKLTLRQQGYEWAFIPIAGQTFTDSGAEACRPASVDSSPPTQPSNLTATAPPNRVDLSWRGSSDNVGIAGYDVIRNGATLATVGAVTSYSDETVAPLTTYTYEVRARDASGNVSAPSNAVTLTTPEAPRIHTFAAVADARVQEANAATNYGTSTGLGTDAGPAVETYLRFDVTGLSGAVQSARLRLYATNGSADGPHVRQTSNGWGETALNWSNRPAPTASATDDRGIVTSSTYAEWDVTPAVNGDGTVSFVLAQTGTDGADFISREGAANKPQLVVAVTGTPPPPDTTPPSKPLGLTATPSPGKVDLAWTAATDDVGVTGYDIIRDGALLTQIGATAAYADTAVAPNTEYSYAVRARDVAGNVSDLSDSAAATTPSAPTTSTFEPAADARVQEANPATNYGTSTGLGTDAEPAVETYLRFDLGTLSGTVVGARLRLYVTNASADGPAIYPTSPAWSETALTWSNRAARTGPAVDDRGALSSGVFAEWDVTSLVGGGGEVAFVLAQPGTDGADFTSKEGLAANRPQLVVALSSDAPPPPPPPPPDGSPPSVPTGLSASATPGRVELSWTASTDDVGVSGYDVFRNGAFLAQVGVTTTYADTTVAANTDYAYQVRARDAAENVSALSDPASVTTPSAPTTLTFLPAADARVQEANATTNYGGSTSLGTDAGPGVATYLRFDLGTLTGSVQSARLRLYATNGSVDGPAVYGTGTSWTEGGLNWSNRPSATTVAADDRVAITRGAYVEWDVTALVSGGGAVGLLLSQPGTDGADFSSKESGSNRPQLVVTTS